MKTILASLLLALPAHAQDSAMWGGTGCQLVPVDGQTHVAEVRCKNVLTGDQPWTEGDMIAGGLQVHLSVLHGPGDVPGEFSITPPDGYVSIPPHFALDEDGTGVALILPFLGY